MFTFSTRVSSFREVTQRQKNNRKIPTVAHIVNSRKIWTWTKNEKFELNINYDLDLGCFRGMDNREIISWRLRSVRNNDTQQEVQDFSDFSS